MPTIYLPLFWWCLFWTMAAAWPAAGHSWYETGCCSSRDCRPVDVRDIGESGDYYTYDGLRFPKKLSRPSQDENWHVCIMNHGMGQRSIPCIYRPSPGS